MSEIVVRLSIETGMRDVLVNKIVRTAPVRYKTYSIDKRGGGKRMISQPAREVKTLQRALVSILLAKLPVHEAATAYMAGATIRENARRHAANGPILKMDFKDFFPSIKARDWLRYCRQHEIFADESDLRVTTSLLFQKSRNRRDMHLAIGAPSSPELSNVLLFEFDRLIAEAVVEYDVTYTRYADDITFSAPRTGYLNGVQKAVYRTIKSLDFPNLAINREKTTYITKKYWRTVTGLTLTNDGNISIGHAGKRLIHAAVHRASQGKLTVDELSELCGLLAFVNSAEPSFIEVLQRRYGEGVVGLIQKTVIRDTGRRERTGTIPILG